MPKKKKKEVESILYYPEETHKQCFTQSRVFVYRCDMSRVCNMYIFLIGSCNFPRPIDRKIVHIEKYSHPNFAQDHKIPFKIHKNSVHRVNITCTLTPYCVVFDWFLEMRIVKALRMEKKKYMRNILILPFIRLVHAF